MTPNPATDAALVKLELLSRHLHRLVEELAALDDEITNVMYELSGAGELPDDPARFAAFTATLERVDELVAADR
jgi:hypothetical protein